MRVVILGSGVIGVTSAYYLAQAGHDVTVLDRQPGPALETSFANAGQISPGYASPWAAPGIPLKAMKWMLQRHAPLSITRVYGADGAVLETQYLLTDPANAVLTQTIDQPNGIKSMSLSEGGGQGSLSRVCILQ